MKKKEEEKEKVRRHHFVAFNCPFATFGIGFLFCSSDKEHPQLPIILIFRQPWMKWECTFLSFKVYSIRKNTAKQLWLFVIKLEFLRDWLAA
jgi:hypothetical protein